MRTLPHALCVAALVFAPASAAAQFGIAPQVSWGDDTDIGIGARLALRLPTDLPLEATASFDFFFPEEDVIDTYWEANANVNYQVQGVQSPFVPYVGGGLNVARIELRPVDLPGDGTSPGASSTEIGLNLLGGVRYVGTAATPYAEVRFEVGGGEQVVLTGGLIFNVGPGL